MTNINLNSKILQKIAALDINIDSSKQLKLIEQIVESGELGQKALLDLLVDRCIIENKEVDSLDGLIYEFLYFKSLEHIKQKLNSYFHLGLIDLNSSLKFNYQPLQNLLIIHDFKEADKLTQSYLCSLAGLDKNSKRKWLYFTDILAISPEDLYIIDKLWRLYSRGKFGFSIQRSIWLSNNCNWEKFWFTIGWQNNGTLCRYPSDFIWNIDAPSGHLPLFNQLRGVQVILALFNHSAWNQ
uniref:GUN4-like domain-containing protein n=2 Tax=Gracilariopsis TaxID=2781 RepID=A0A1C9CF13_9FLOR|nr:hypothetical protein [Gracilariopsis lemaneiformis]YP_009294716.1 hypothetical protein Gch_117 [Gracilariopsis chorda]AML79959.1 hypothetical protein [Gracilariopsis lemaneiformis]AOM66976.1 hypothetical protein Gch_117 [Gracilariopsis chorda]UAD88762.1 hypothetical protein [Gracilariopsis chorda]